MLADTNLQPDQREAVQMIDKSATGLLNILDDILEYCTLDSGSNQEMGTLVLQSVKFDSLELVERCLMSYAKAAEEKGILFFLLFTCTETNFLGDPWGVKQILHHLIGNAIKFTDRGFVKVHLHAEKQETSENSWRVFISVEDSGIGIPEEKIGNLFGVFTQGNDVGICQKNRCLILCCS
jgi:signal transduction histidine kinase